MKKTPWIFFALTAAGFLSTGSVQGQRLVVLVERDTGALRVRNTGDAPFHLNGYEVTSPSGLLNLENWNSLTQQGVAGFVEANPREVEIAELAFPPAAAVVNGGETLDLGNAYRAGARLPSEEDVGFRFTSTAGDIFAGNVHYVGPPQVPSISIDRATGSIQLFNPSGFAIDGYTIASPSGRLLPDAFVGLADQNIPGWFEAQPSERFLSELNPQGSQAFAGGVTFDLGRGYNAAGVVKSDEDVTFRYSTPEGVVSEGAVNYTGPIPDLVLQVDSITGSATIQNTSASSGPFDVVAYNIFSPSSSLSVETWNSLSDSGAGGPGWVEANPSADALAELNPTGSTVFTTGTAISIGRILSGAEDLVFEYATTAGAAFGSVDYVLGLAPPGVGDCNGDGVLDAADLACVSTVAERDAVLAALNTLPGDLDGNGDVAFADFLTLSANFGQNVPSYTAGNIDLMGDVGFPDFLTLSANFGETPSGAAAVPEPSTSLLALVGLLACRCRRCRRRDL